MPLYTDPVNTLVILPSGAHEASAFRLDTLVRISGQKDADAFLAACRDNEDLLVNLSRDCDPETRVDTHGDASVEETRRKVQRTYLGRKHVVLPETLLTEKAPLHALADQLAVAGHSVAVFPSLPGGRSIPTLVSSPLDLTFDEIINAYRMPAPEYVANADSGFPVSLLVQAGRDILNSCSSFGMQLLAANSRIVTVLPYHGAPMSAHTEQPIKNWSAALGTITKLLGAAAASSIDQLIAEINQTECSAHCENVPYADAENLFEALKANAPWLARHMDLRTDFFDADDDGKTTPILVFGNGATLHYGNEHGEEAHQWVVGQMTYYAGGRHEPPSEDWDVTDQIADSVSPEMFHKHLGDILHGQAKHLLGCIFEGMDYAADQIEISRHLEEMRDDDQQRIAEAQRSIRATPPEASVQPGDRIRTEDGYVFTMQADGSLTDGDLTFESIRDLDVGFCILDSSDRSKKHSGPGF